MPLNNAIPSYESLLEFQEVWLRAIALAWRDEEFKKELLKDPEYAMLHYLSYRTPWAAGFEAVEAHGEQYGWDDEKGKWHLPKGNIALVVPNRPEGDLVRDIPLALASYNDCGPLYLFTCC